MEGLDRLVTESLARHGFDRSVDYRRLHWSPWFRCESPHSLLTVPSKPGVFAIAEEIVPLAEKESHVWDRVSDPVKSNEVRQDINDRTRAAAATGSSKRMLAVLQFCEEDDMAFVLDRIFTRPSPMRTRLMSGRCFVRYVVLEDALQRRSICAALNQWLVSSGERVSGIGAHFASSLELPGLEPAKEPVAREEGVERMLPGRAEQAVQPEPPLSKSNATPNPPVIARPRLSAPALVRPLDTNAGASTHPLPLPSGF